MVKKARGIRQKARVESEDGSGEFYNLLEKGLDFSIMLLLFIMLAILIVNILEMLAVGY